MYTQSILYDIKVLTCKTQLINTKSLFVYHEIYVGPNCVDRDSAFPQLGDYTD